MSQMCADKCLFPSAIGDEPGWPPKLIRDRPNLTDQQVTDALGYIAEHRAAVEAEYQQGLDQAEENRRYWEERDRECLTQIAALPPKPEQASVRAKIAASRRSRQAARWGVE
jgi:hypothetical protein